MEINQEKSQKNEKFLEKLQKINPYRKLLVSKEDGFVLDSISFVYYQKIVQWLLDILLNGFFLWIILFTFGLQPLHWLCIIADGILVWFFFEILTKIKETIK